VRGSGATRWLRPRGRGKGYPRRIKGRGKMIRSVSCWITACVTLALCPGAVASQLEYQVRGTLTHFAGEDHSLDGASFLFSGLIDSDALPFFAIPGEVRAYEGDSLATAQITGSLLSDGLYTDVLDHPISVQVRLKGTGADELEIWHNGYFEFLGPSGPDFRFVFQFLDTTGEAFSGMGVPGTDVDETDFDIDDGWLTYSTPDRAVIFAYRAEIESLRIIPEPTTCLLLLGGGVLVWGRGRRSRSS